MKAYRVELVCRQFTFLAQVAGLLEGGYALYYENVDDIQIRRGDENLLARTPYDSAYTWSGGRSRDYDLFFAVTTDGEGWSVQELASAGNYATGSGERHEFVADPVGEQLFARQLDPQFVVMVSQQDTDANGNGRCQRRWFIYKMSRFDLVSYHQSQVDRAAAELKAEIAAAFAAD